MKKWMSVAIVFLLSGAMAGCGWLEQGQGSSQAENADGVTAMAATDKLTYVLEIINTEGKKIGQAVLTEVKEGVQVELMASQLPPGEHGFHFHEKGVCATPDFKSAGGHFNPFDKSHGLKDPKGPHAGDMPNIVVGADGKVSVKLVNPLVTLKEGEKNSLRKPGGTALMIHAKPDDMVSDPSGDAGDRIACGTIQ